MAIPSRVQRCDGFSAVVETAGQLREVSLVLLDEAVAPGDYLLVRNGHLAYERIDAERARDMLAAIGELLATTDDDRDLRRW